MAEASRVSKARWRSSKLIEPATIFSPADFLKEFRRRIRTGKEIRFRFWLQRGQGWQGSKTQAYWLVVRVLLTPPVEAAASQKWKMIYLQVLS
jgi:hypothetical protein